MTNLLLNRFNEGWEDYYNGRSEFIIKAKSHLWYGEMNLKIKVYLFMQSKGWAMLYSLQGIFF